VYLIFIFLKTFFLPVASEYGDETGWWWWLPDQVASIYRNAWPHKTLNLLQVVRCLRLTPHQSADDSSTGMVQEQAEESLFATVLFHRKFRARDLKHVLLISLFIYLFELSFRQRPLKVIIFIN